MHFSFLLTLFRSSLLTQAQDPSFISFAKSTTMSIVFHLNQFPTNPYYHPTTKPATNPPNIYLPSQFLTKIPRNLISCRKSKEFKVLASAFDGKEEWEPERNENDGETEKSDAETSVVVEESEIKGDEETDTESETETDTEIDKLKKELSD